MPIGGQTSAPIDISNPAVTRNAYECLFGNTDERTAAAVETALAGALTVGAP